MLKQFLNHITDKRLLLSGDHTLLAVSGGVDSMVMLDLFIKAGFSIAVAHCNFQLRSDASDADEALVKGVCERHQIPCYVRRFDTSEYAEKRNLSIQVAARHLRYQFFGEISRQLSCHHIATAHHADDTIETVFLNLLRGTGIEGLAGIRMSNGQVIRPMLFARRAEILEYARKEHIQWREDESNTSDKYERNALRLTVIPELQKIRPGFTDTMLENIRRMEGYASIVNARLAEFIKRCVTSDRNRIIIDHEAMKQFAAPDLLLWEFVKRYGFRYDQVSKIWAARQSGRQISSDSAVLLFDRDRFILDTSTSAALRVEIPPGEQRVENAMGHLEFVVDDSGTPAEIVKKYSYDKDVACLDADLITFPLTWRTWQQGDSFTPLGMQHQKKVSDMLIDWKVDMLTKSRVTVIESSGDIVWLVGFRINHKFRISDKTRRVLVMKFVPTLPDKSQENSF